MKAWRILSTLILCALVSGIAQTSIAKEDGDRTDVEPVYEEMVEERSETGKGAAPDKAVYFGNRYGPSWDGRENYSDRYINELSIAGGNYLGENWKNTYYIGAQYLFHLNDTFAFGAQYKYSPIVVDKDTPFYASLSTDTVNIATSLCQLNTPASWKIGKTMYNMDFYFTLGVGAIEVNRKWNPTGVIGGGVRMYFPVPWIAFRLDVTSYIHMTPLGNRDDLSGDVAMGGAISFLFPSRPKGYYKNKKK